MTEIVNEQEYTWVIIYTNTWSVLNDVYIDSATIYNISLAQMVIFLVLLIIFIFLKMFR